ncbi:enoyl-CoA hydratase/isomerase family protein [Actinomadura sp. SCN-SB]|uniref:enoyl-CoA hydratase/isomerase family protein n=1 Tax=Actinomadura sp. SCN-SB TaxID=3373092 RepID=UPI0037532E97
MAESLSTVRTGPVTTITIDRPHRMNAITPELWADLLAAFRQVADSDTRVLVLTGAGGNFCTGADLSGDEDAGRPLTFMRTVEETCLALHRLDVPVIARVDGYAVGAGMNLALACDFVVASDRARFSQIFARRGLTIDAGGSWLLPRLVGLHRAKELAMLGDMIGADTAREYGLVHSVVPAADLDAAVAALAERLAAGPPAALGLIKRLLNRSFESDFAGALANETVAQSLIIGSDDAREALDAFREKREPRFTGR